MEQQYSGTGGPIAKVTVLESANRLRLVAAKRTRSGSVVTSAAALAHCVNVGGLRRSSEAKHHHGGRTPAAKRRSGAGAGIDAMLGRVKSTSHRTITPRRALSWRRCLRRKSPLLTCSAASRLAQLQLGDSHGGGADLQPRITPQAKHSRHQWKRDGIA